jgi:hypothetical protein
MYMESNYLTDVSDSTSAAKGDAVVMQILGRLGAKNAHVEGDAYGNSTRWVFDVAFSKKGSIELELLFKYTCDKEKALIKSYTLAPLSSDFWDAKPWVEENGDTFTLHANGPCSIRVAIDTIHSATR